MTALSLSRVGPRTRRRSRAQPVEYNLLLTATLCLLAFGVVMVFSASSTTSLLGNSGDSAYYLKRTLLFGAGGLLVMRVLSLRGARLVRPLTPLLVATSFLLLLAIVIEPYRMQRLTGFVHPSGDPGGAGFQAIQAKIALGSGGIFGVGLGQSLQKAFYLPEAHTDMIAAVVGEELGLVGISMLVGVVGVFCYAGLRTAQRGRDRYGKVLAPG